MRLLMILLLTTACRTNDVDNTEGKTIDDHDMDGFSIEEDCDDDNSAVHPGAEETCNDIDDNCNGFIDDEDPLIADADQWFADADGDGFGSVQYSQMACNQPEWYVDNSVDCNDMSADAYPGADELCDLLDNDCDGYVDEELGETWYADLDGDGFGDPDVAEIACFAPLGYVPDNSDCDDADASVNPSSIEFCDSLDNNCNGDIDENSAVDASLWHMDQDADGYGDLASTAMACQQPFGYVSDSTDCDDADLSIYPGAPEYCDAVDSDCDGVVDESDSLDANIWYADADSDGYGDLSTFQTACFQPVGYLFDASDCNDANAVIYPGAPEYCDAVDSDCDGVVDESDSLDALVWYADIDGDSFGNAAFALESCAQPQDYVSDSSDCDDGAASTYPGAMETIDGADENCNGLIDDGTAVYDDDGDGQSEDDGDCDDADIDVYDGAPEICDDIDSDCDGDLVDEDSDFDGDLIPDCIDPDIDGDGFDNVIDNCPDDPNPGQYDYDQNGSGDACDVFYQCPMFGFSQNLICFPPFGNGAGCNCDCMGQVQSSPTCLQSTLMGIGFLTCNEDQALCTPIVNNECALFDQSNGSIVGTVPCDTL